MATATETAALIVAAGRGLRAGAGEIPKQYQSIGGRAILARSLDLFLAHPEIDTIQVVIAEADGDLYARIAPRHEKLRPPVIGGASRQASVQNGLAALAVKPLAKVLIHDAARPFASPSLLTRVVAALANANGVVPTIPVTSTLKRVAAGHVTATVPRDDLEAAETPQGFAFAAIRDAHEKAAAAGLTFTDDAAVGEWAGMAIATVVGEPANVKLTTAGEIAAADRRLTMEEAMRLGDVRVGIGFDVHAIGAGSEVVLGGVAIPHTRGLIGHSDADVVLHALTDAILGALGEGDIGEHFPPTDDQWKGASSDRFLAAAATRVAERGGMIAHLDVSFVGQEPKIAPHREAMRARIAEIAGVAIDRVGVQATTNEGLGFIGRGEGSAAYAVATVQLPFTR